VLRPLLPLLLLLTIALAAPAQGRAETYQGSIAGLTVAPSGTSVTAQISVTAHCDQTPYAYCGFFPLITTGPSTQPCQPTITGSSWVGNNVSRPFNTLGDVTTTQTATWREWPTLYPGDKRGCLYEGSGRALLAEVFYTVPAPAPPPVYQPPVVQVPDTPAAPSPAPVAPATTPAAPAVELESLGYGEAVSAARDWLSRKYGRRWAKGRGRTVRCPIHPWSAQRGCTAVWRYKGKRYSKSVVVTESATDYAFNSSFATAPEQPVAPAPSPAPTPVPTPAPTPSPSPAPSGGDFCATHVCNPNYPNGTGSTVQCSDGSYSHSGGKQGACSHHGGVARRVDVARASALARLARTRTAAMAAERARR
jgi:hypothetical protein